VLDDDTLVTQSWRTVERFERRAAQIMRTDIAKRPDLDTVGRQIHLRIGPDGAAQVQVRRDRPEDAHIFHAAAVLRPLIIQRDPVYHGTLFKALGYLTRDAPPPWPVHVRNQKRAWQLLTTQSYWSMQIGDVDHGWTTELRTDRQIAMDWLYADVVHADTARQEAIRHIPEEDRLLAGVLLVRDGIVLTDSTTKLINALEAADALSGRPAQADD
jgi:hypothetical protein